MFPTFISILDIQSWWEVPSIAHFCSLFRSAFNLLDFDIEDLEEALLTDGTEETSWLQELIVRLLSGCLANNEISTFNYQMFLRRVFRQKCQEHDRYNPFNTDIDFQVLPLRTKVDILHSLCDFRLDAEDVLEQLKNLEADSLRVEPLGYDSNQSAYWYFYGTRLYREDFHTKNVKKKPVWQVICFTEDDWLHLTKKFKKSSNKAERLLYQTLSENFLPELPRLFKEKEKLARKRLLDNQPRRTSDRLRKTETPGDKEEEEQSSKEEDTSVDDEKKRKRELELKRQEAYDRRSKLKEHSEDSQSETSDATSYDMAGKKDKKSKTKQAKVAETSTSKKDKGKSEDVSPKSKSKGAKTPPKHDAGKVTVGRRTNNSLAATTGEIVIDSIESFSNPRKKLKTSQVFRQTDEDLQIGMHKILDYVKDHDDAWPFVDPVEEEYAPNYYSVIRKPMDLQKMEEKLDNGSYKNYNKFKSDFQLIVDNCRLYNGAENEYTEMVNNLQKVFERATQKYLDEISSSDDEVAVVYTSKKSRPIEKSENKPKKTASKRKPTLAAKTDKKRDSSLSESDLSETEEPVKVESKKSKKIEKKTEKEKVKSKVKDRDKETKEREKEKDKEKENKKVKSAKNEKSDKSEKSSKKDKFEKEMDKEKEQKKNKKAMKSNKVEKTKEKIKKERSTSPEKRKKIRISRSRSRSPALSDSPPPSWPPSSPEPGAFDFDKHKNKSKKNQDFSSDDEPSVKNKRKFDFDDLKKTPPKHVEKSNPPKDKHNKLRETIEKLKAKSEQSKIDSKIKEVVFDKPSPKEKEIKNKKHTKDEAPTKAKHVKEKKHKHSENQVEDNKNTKSKSNSLADALSLATEQTLKDINKWLDDTPKISTDFSSASNSPSYASLEELDIIGGYKVDPFDPKKKLDPKLQRKDTLGKEVKRRAFHRDPPKFLKRREIQRTIDRLQPGKGKGNLISNVQNSPKVDELFPLGPINKNKDLKNSLIVKADDNAPKLSLGSVLDSFGKHKFQDDPKKEETSVADKLIKSEIKPDVDAPKTEEAPPKNKDEKPEIKPAKTETVEKKESSEPPPHVGEATPNLSAWFKAFGAPKVAPPAPKKDSKVDKDEDKDKEDEKADKPKEDVAKVALPHPSPSLDSPMSVGGQATRQRRISTGSSMSERSSFSQDMDSPRVGMDERGAYPAPYPSPLHKSPSGASPVMASPRPDFSPKSATYPTINGQMRVGFYQDTVSNKSSPDKSCSPKTPQSPYAPQHSEHVYPPPNTTAQNLGYSYAATGAPFYSTSAAASVPYSSHSPNSAYKVPPSQEEVPKVQQPQPRQVQQEQPMDIEPTPKTMPVQERVVHPQPQTIFPVKKRIYNDVMQDQYANLRSSPAAPPADLPPKQPKPYVHQNIPEPKPSLHHQYPNKNQSPVSVSASQHPSSVVESTLRGYSYNDAYPSDSPYSLTVPRRSAHHDMNAAARKIDMSKFTNMGYAGPEVNFSRGLQQYNIAENSYVQASTSVATSTQQTSTNSQVLAANNMRYASPNTLLPTMTYKGMETPQQHPSFSSQNPRSALENQSRLPQTTSDVYKASEAMQRNYNSNLNMAGNLANLSHIVDRYNSDERMSYYADNGLPSHIFNKNIVTSASALPIFSSSNMAMAASFNQGMQTLSSSMYNRQLNELPSPATQPSINQTVPEKKVKKSRKSAKASTSTAPVEPTQNPSTNVQGFQSYAGLKSNPMDAGAISLKSAAVVPGSAFNFGPTPSGLPALYDNPNFLDDYRSNPNYYMHHRPEAPAAEKQGQPPSYPFLGGPQAPRPGYPLGGPFMPSQAQLMDPSSPLYQHYLQAGVLNQGLLGHAGAYPPGYLSIRQPYDPMTRPTWL